MDSLRIGDADREEAVRLLGEQYAVGRLTKDELDERSDAVWTAKTRGDLAPLFVDLPVGRPRTPVGPAPVRSSRTTRRRSIPLLPVLLVLIGLALLTKPVLVLLAVALWFWVLRPQMSGRRFADRGSCSYPRRTASPRRSLG